MKFSGLLTWLPLQHRHLTPSGGLRSGRIHLAVAELKKQVEQETFCGKESSKETTRMVLLVSSIWLVGGVALFSWRAQVENYEAIPRSQHAMCASYRNKHSHP